MMINDDMELMLSGNITGEATIWNLNLKMELENKSLDQKFLTDFKVLDLQSFTKIEWLQKCDALCWVKNRYAAVAFCGETYWD